MEESVQSLRRAVSEELDKAKRRILDRMRCRLEESLHMPENARSLPLICLADGLDRNYSGKAVTVRENMVRKQPRKALQKRPSVLLQVEDQSFVFDGDGLKMIGGIGSEYKGMVDEINSILRKHMK